MELEYNYSYKQKQRIQQSESSEPVLLTMLPLQKDVMDMDMDMDMKKNKEVQPRNIRMKRTFGLELTNFVNGNGNGNGNGIGIMNEGEDNGGNGNRNCSRINSEDKTNCFMKEDSGSGNDGRPQVKGYSQKRLKRSFTSAQLDDKYIPPLKKYRHNVFGDGNNEVTINPESGEKNNKIVDETKKKSMEEVKFAMIANDDDIINNKKRANNRDEKLLELKQDPSIKVSNNDSNNDKKNKNEVVIKNLNTNVDIITNQILPPLQEINSNIEKNNDNNANLTHPNIVKYFEDIYHPAIWDLQDLSNDWACVHYVNDIMNRLKATEERQIYSDDEHKDYMSWQKEITPRMRIILLDWIIDVHRKFELLPATLYLCVNLLDRYLSVIQVQKNKLQLTGCACLWLASKYHEIYAPDIRDFVFISDDAFTEEELIKQESNIVDQLKFQLTVPTSFSFAERYLKIGTYDGLALKNQRILRCLMNYLLEHCLMSYQLSRELPSKIAAACLAYTLLATKSYITWPKFLEEETYYSIKELLPVIESIDEIVKMDCKLCKHKAVRKKYASRRFYQVSLLSFSKVHVKLFE